MPPFKGIFAPFINADWSLKRKLTTFATSCSLQSLRSGVFRASICFSFGDMSKVYEVLIIPGEIAFDRIPLGPNSIANDLVKPQSADFAATYEDIFSGGEPEIILVNIEIIDPPFTNLGTKYEQIA